eukprot:g4252.t1
MLKSGCNPLGGHSAHDALKVILYPFTLLFIGGLSRYYAPFLRIPFTVVQLVIGVALGVIATHFEGALGALGESAFMMKDLDPHLLLHIFLPALIFESAFTTDWHVFTAVKNTCLLLAGPGLLMATFLTGAATKVAIYPEWSWELCLLFGALLSATDPVAVVAVLKELGVKESLSVTIEGESLLNDGVAVVVFVLFFPFVSESRDFDETPLSILVAFLRMAVLAIFYGAASGYAVATWLSYIFNDGTLEVTITIFTTYLLYFVAEFYIGTSGVLSVVAFGLYFASINDTCISPEQTEAVEAVWDMLSFCGNTLLFGLTGFAIGTFDFSSVSTYDWSMLLVLYIVCTIARSLVFTLAYPLVSGGAYGMTQGDCVVSIWGALRGAVGLALGLMVYVDASGPGKTEAEKDAGAKVLFHTCGIVVLTLIVNSTSIEQLLDKLGYTFVPPQQEKVMQLALQQLHEVAEQEIELLQKDPLLSCANWDHIRSVIFTNKDRGIKEDENLSVEEKEEMVEEVTIAHTVAESRRRFLLAVKAGYRKLFETGIVSSGALRHLLEANECAYDERYNLSIEWKALLHNVPFLRYIAMDTEHAELEHQHKMEKDRYVRKLNLHKLSHIAIERAQAQRANWFTWMADLYVKQTEEDDLGEKRKGLLSWFLKQILAQHVCLCCNMVSGFLHVREESMDAIVKFLRTHGDTENSIGSEHGHADSDAVFEAQHKWLPALRGMVHQDMNTATKVLLRCQELFPDLAAKSETLIGGRQTINIQRITVQKLSEEGLLDDEEENKILQHLDSKIKRSRIWLPPTSESVSQQKEILLHGLAWLEPLGAYVGVGAHVQHKKVINGRVYINDLVKHDTFKKLLLHTKTLNFSKLGSHILEAGSKANAVFIVARGSVEVVIPNNEKDNVAAQKTGIDSKVKDIERKIEQGKEEMSSNGLRLLNLGRGAPFNLMAFLTETAAPFMIRTSSRICRIFAINGDFINSNPDIKRALWQYAASEMATPILRKESPWSEWAPTSLRRSVASWNVRIIGNDSKNQKNGNAIAVHFKRPVLLLTGSATQPQHEHLDDDVDEDHDFENEKSILLRAPCVMRSQDSKMPNAHYIVWIASGSRIYCKSNAVVGIISTAKDMKEAHVTRSQSNRMCKDIEAAWDKENVKHMAKTMMTMMTSELASNSEDTDDQITKTLEDMRHAHHEARTHHTKLNAIVESKHPEAKVQVLQTKKRSKRQWNKSINNALKGSVLSKVAPETLPTSKNTDWVIEEDDNGDPPGFL